MSLSIDCRFVTGIYALGQWFKVKPNTIDVDAYEFRNWHDLHPDPKSWDEGATDYSMGAIYQDPNPGEQLGGDYGEHSRKRWERPTGSNGISFIDEDTGERVSFSLLEVRGFRERRGDFR